MQKTSKYKDRAALLVSSSTLAFYSWFKIDLPFWFILFAILLGFYAIIKRYNYWKMVVLTLKRDLGYLKLYANLYFPGKSHQRNNSVVPSVFEENVKKYPNKICFYFEDQAWTFKQISELSNRIAHVFDEAGFKRGETVALFMENRPEYVGIWLGLAKVGIVTALVNTNLRDKSLLHALNIVDAKAVIFGNEFAEALESLKGKLSPSIRLYGFDMNSNDNIPNGAINMDNLLKIVSSSPLPGPQRCNYGDKILYIYTSGTTGLPKAAVIKHSRFLFVAYGGFHSSKIQRKDTIYVTLPLYHTVGGMIGIGNALIFGCTVVLRKKFSVSQFWHDCIRYECTAFQYIGEMCRYLLSSPPRPEDKSHKIRLMFGNGLRPQIWEEFVHRFNIPNVAEIYGSTEGNSSIVNNTGRVGAIGAVSLIAPSVFPLALIRVSQETGEPLRGPDGLCIRCLPGETGMFIAKIRVNNPFSDLPGYIDAEATRKKIVHDVFSKGDSHFLSGDILSMDDLGYLYFKDRIGDTFRWKSENVSTTEVEAIISNATQLRDACVYGVEIPGSEGRVGMAAIVDTENSLDLAALAKELQYVLPSYARPLFIRLVKEIDLTGTYKLRKIDYRNEAYDLTKVKDPIYFLDPFSQSYIPFTSYLCDQLLSGKLKV